MQYELCNLVLVHFKQVQEMSHAFYNYTLVFVLVIAHVEYPIAHLCSLIRADIDSLSLSVWITIIFMLSIQLCT